MKKWVPNDNPDDFAALSGYINVQAIVHAIKQCGDDLTRENLLKQATNLKGQGYKMMLPGVRLENWGNQRSGGEQQMLAIARALMANPTLILMDEPSEGLSPKLVQKVEEIMLRLRSEGHAILMVEQNLALAMAVADRIYVLSSGSFVFQGTPSELSGNPEILDGHLGVSLAAPH